jgi:hypothetical protein
MFVEAKKLSQEPLDTIPVSGFSNFFADDNAQPVVLLFIPLRKKDEVLGGEFLSKSHYVLEILRIADPFLLLETINSCCFNHHQEIFNFKPPIFFFLSLASALGRCDPLECSFFP